jgi:hypothetical protein
LMMMCWMMLGKIVGNFGFSRGPINAELLLVDAVTDQVKLHVNTIRALLLDSAFMMPAAVEFSVANTGWVVGDGTFQ